MARRLTLLEDPRYRDFWTRYHADPLRFAIEVCGMVPSEDQADLLIAMSDPEARVSVVSGTGTGKTAAFGRIALWHLLCHPYGLFDGEVQIGSNTYIGAPLVQQVGDGVWKEMQDARIAMGARQHAWILSYFTIGKTRVTVRGFEDQWFIAQIALARGKAVGVAGKHRYWQLIIIDEAIGVPDEHFDVIDGTQTQGGNRTLMASQGARSSGRFYDSHHSLSTKNGGAWLSLRFRSDNSPFVTPKWLKDREIETGGKDSVEYQIRVLGLFPEQGDKYLVSRSAIAKLIGGPSVVPESAPWGNVLTIDVAAGVYRDKTVVMHSRVWGNGDRLDDDPRRVEVVGIPVFSNSLDWQGVVGRVVDYCRLLSNVTLVVDIGGQGEQFARMLEQAGLTNIVRVLWGETNFKKKYKTRFFNQRAQCSVHAAEAVKDGRITFTNEYTKELLDQGSRIPFFFDEKARFHIVPKEKMKEDEGLPSPDLWDAVCMTFLENAHYTVADRGGDRQSEAARNVADQMAADLAAMLDKAFSALRQRPWRGWLWAGVAASARFARRLGWLARLGRLSLERQPVADRLAVFAQDGLA